LDNYIKLPLAEGVFKREQKASKTFISRNALFVHQCIVPFWYHLQEKGREEKKGKRVNWGGSYGVTKRTLIEVFHIILYVDYLN
jgi:hypothetical protein